MSSFLVPFTLCSFIVPRTPSIYIHIYIYIYILSLSVSIYITLKSHSSIFACKDRIVIKLKMGLCLSRDNKSTAKKRPPSKRITNHSEAAAVGRGGGGGSMRIRSSRKEGNLINEQALAAAILFQQQLQNGGAAPFDRSASLRYPSGNSKRNQALNRSSSSRTRSLTDPLLQPHQLINQVNLVIWIAFLFCFYLLLFFSD